MFHARAYALCLTAFCCCPAIAVATPLQLEPLTVPGTAEPPLAAAAKVDADALALTPLQTLDAALARMPGVFSQNRNNLAQGLRPAIRGFGARAAFGVRGIRVLVDGVPLTLPDGQTDLDALDLRLVERMDVVRGPSAALFGNAAGGVIALTTRQPAEAFEARASALAGAFDTHRLRAEASGPVAAGWRGLAAVNWIETSGPRAHNGSTQAQLTAKASVDAGGGIVDVALSVIDVQAQDPGALTAEQVRADREQAAPRNLQLDGGERVRQQRLSVSWQRSGLATTAYAGRRAFTARLPFQGGGQIAFDRRFGGLGAAKRFDWDAAAWAHEALIGLDAQTQRDDRERFDNLDGARGAQTLSQQETATSAGLYANHTASIRRWQLQAGLRADALRLAVDDAFLSDGDDSGARRFNNLSGSASAAYAWSPAWSSHLRWSTAFETPTNTELANPNGGGFNPDVEAARARNIELGTTARWAVARLSAVVFQIDLDDELQPFERDDQPGRTFFRNAGQSTRRGVELEGGWSITPSWSATLAYTYGRFTFDTGREIPGIPRQHGFAALNFARHRWAAEITLAAVDRLFADDASTRRVPGYAVVNVAASREFRLPGSALTIVAGARNLLDRDYNDNVRINAFGGRSFEPAPGVNGYLEAKLSMN